MKEPAYVDGTPVVPAPANVNGAQNADTFLYSKLQEPGQAPADERNVHVIRAVADISARAKLSSSLMSAREFQDFVIEFRTIQGPVDASVSIRNVLARILNTQIPYFTRQNRAEYNPAFFNVYFAAFEQNNIAAMQGAPQINTLYHLSFVQQAIHFATLARTNADRPTLVFDNLLVEGETGRKVWFVAPTGEFEYQTIQGDNAQDRQNNAMAYVMDGAVNDVLQYVTVVFSQARPYIYKLVQFIEVLLASVPVAHHAGLNSLKTCLRACLVAPTDLPSLLDWIRKLAKLYRRFTVPLNDQLVDPVQGDVAQFGGNAQPVQAAGAWNVGTLNAMGAAAQLNTFIATIS